MEKTKKTTEKPEISKSSAKRADFKFNQEEMVNNGLHFGHRVSQINPKMKPYIFGVRNGIHIIDVEKTAEKLAEALDFVQQLIMEQKVLLLVGTKIQVKDKVKETAKICSVPYVSERWLGGTFTNFETISKRIQFFKDLEKKKVSGELEKYTKKERAKFDQKLKDFETKFGGIKDMNRLPDAVFVMDMIEDGIAIKEARAKGVKIVAIVHTNADPTQVDFPIPANDDAVSSVSYILDQLKEAVLKVKPKAK